MDLKDTTYSVTKQTQPGYYCNSQSFIGLNKRLVHSHALLSYLLERSYRKGINLSEITGGGPDRPPSEDVAFQAIRVYEIKVFQSLNYITNFIFTVFSLAQTKSQDIAVEFAAFTQICSIGKCAGSMKITSPIKSGNIWTSKTYVVPFCVLPPVGEG